MAAFPAGMAMELTCAAWAEGVDLHLIGVEVGLAPAERVTVHDDLDEVVELAEGSARPPPPRSPAPHRRWPVG